MLVLLIMLVPTISVNADTYTTRDDIVIDTKYYEFFKGKFGEDTSYKFFAYECYRSNSSYSSTCYFGIDNDNNYYKISYNSENNLEITSGIDDNFVLNGTNYIEIQPSYNSVLTYVFCFILVLFVFMMMW